MSIQKTSTLLVILLVPIISLFSQKRTVQSTIDTIPIKNQFEYIYNKSNSHKQYKVVSKNWYAKLQKNTLDSLNAVHTLINTSKAEINKQLQQISSLEEELKTANSNFNKAKAEKDNMPLLGVQMSKSSYTATMWGIIFTLLGGLILFIYKYNGSNALTKEAQKLLRETESEFEEHRRNALEREQKVRRQLQDELNKQKSKVS